MADCLIHLTMSFYLVTDTDVDETTMNALVTAIQNGNKEEVEYICSLESANNDDFTLNYLINNSDTTQRYDYRTETSPLCLAASLDNVDIVRVLLSHGAEADYGVGDCFKTPLHIACSKEEQSDNNTYMVKELISSGADVNLQDDNGQTAILFACLSNNMDIIRCLLEKNVDLDVADYDDNTPLLHACNTDNFELIQMLVNHGCQVDFPKNAPLRTCISKGNIPAVKLFLEHGEDIHKKPYLSTACECNKLDMIDFIYSLGVDINKRRTSDISFHFTALHSACLSRSTETFVVEKLLAWGADVNLKSTTGDVALHYAAQWLHCHKVKTLLQFGALVNVVNEIGYTPLMAGLSCYFLYPKHFICLIDLFTAAGYRISTKETDFVPSNHQAKKLDIFNSEILPYLKSKTRNTMSLKSICRIKVRNSINCNIRKNIENLQLPKILIDYLNFEDIFIPEKILWTVQ